MPESTLDVNGVRYPVTVHVERRRTVRASIGKRGVVIRLPAGLPARERETHLRRLMGWAAKRLEDRPVRAYRDGDELVAAGRRHRIRLVETGSARSSARLRGAEIVLRLPRGMGEGARRIAIGAMLSRCLAREHRSWLEERVAALNKRHFRVPVTSVTFRNTTSTWGSCSRAGRLSFATRLLLAPLEIVDYVCIHELAHRLVPNHSRAFWDLVRRALPDAEERRRWLHRHGNELVW
jgi:predicted metal-dependent hydrolase